MRNSLATSRMRQPLFIMGVGRSGTTFLLKLVNSLTNVRLLYESDIILPIFQMFQKRDVLASKESFLSFIDRLRQLDRGGSPKTVNSAFDQSERVYLELYQRTRQHRNVSDFIEDLFTLGANHVTFWGDKSADFRQIDTVKQLSPHAKFIFIIRDARAVCHSARIHSKTNLYTTAFLWTSAARKCTEIQRRFPENTLILKYEELVTNVRSEFSKIARFLNTSPSQEPSILERAHSKSLEKWRNGLSGEEVKKIEEIAFAQMSHYEYIPEVARSAKRMGSLRYLILLLQHGAALLQSRRVRMSHLIKYETLVKYIRIYRKWGANL